MNNYELQWRFALPVELLNPQQVHVWRADLDVAKSEMEKLLEILSPDEIDRAGRFHFEIDKKRYVTARGILR
ncbi:MAG: hypothetical protein ABI863_03780, partial [Ginsengibacter sp.]